jgi:hypothetical protein
LLTAIQAGTALTLVDSSNMQVAIFR